MEKGLIGRMPEFKVTFRWDDGVHLTELPLKYLSPAQKAGWLTVAQQYLAALKSLDLAILATDLCYILGIQPNTKEHLEMTARYKRTFYN